MTEEISNKLNNLKIFHRVDRNHVTTRRSIVNIPEVDRKISYLIGVILGDGNITISKRKRGGFHYRIKVTSNSMAYLRFLNVLFHQKFGIKGTLEKDRRKENTYYLVVQNAVIFWYFLGLGLNYGKKVSLIPSVIKLKEKLFPYFLSGLVDTDGSIQNKRIHLKQKSKEFLEELRVILERLKMNPNEVKINYTNSKPFYYLRFDNKLPKLPQ
jgi:intein/homing endonuclease